MLNVAVVLLTWPMPYSTVGSNEIAARFVSMDKKIIYSIIGVMVFIVIGLAALVWLQFRGPSVPAYDADTITDFEGPAVDSAARIEIEKLRHQIEALTEQTKALENRINTIESRPMTTQPTQDDQSGYVRGEPNEILHAYAQVVQIAARRDLNKGVNIATPSYLESVFGRPREVLSNKCESMTNQRLADKLVLENVGPIRVHMLRPAAESLRRVFEKIYATDPDLYDRIKSSGSLCVRHIRGSPGRASTHSFGLSVDLNIDGKLDTLGDGKTQLGLTILADFFRNEGWYWGAAFSREDSMHFEVSRDLIEKWIAEGRL